jgi:hypothetical protein
MQKTIERRVIEIIDYGEWCEKEKLPKDSTSRLVYKQWVQSTPTLQSIIDNIVADQLDRAYDDFTQYMLKNRIEPQPRR